MILKIILWIFLGLFILIFISPIHVYVSFFNELSIKIRFWFFCFDLSKKETKVLKEKNIASKKEKKNFFMDTLKKRGLSGFIDLLKGIVNASSFALKKFLKKVKVDKFSLKITVISEDAAATAINYGKICAIVYPLISSLRSFLRIMNPQIDIKPDFKNVESQNSNVSFVANVHIFVFSIFTIAISTLCHFIKIRRSFFYESTSN